jgi:hypothetical protein
MEDNACGSEPRVFRALRSRQNLARAGAILICVLGVGCQILLLLGCMPCLAEPCRNRYSQGAFAVCVILWFLIPKSPSPSPTPAGTWPRRLVRTLDSTFAAMFLLLSAVWALFLLGPQQELPGWLLHLAIYAATGGFTGFWAVKIWVRVAQDEGPDAVFGGYRGAVAGALVYMLSASVWVDIARSTKTVLESSFAEDSALFLADHSFSVCVLAAILFALAPPSLLKGWKAQREATPRPTEREGGES